MASLLSVEFVKEKRLLTDNRLVLWSNYEILGGNMVKWQKVRNMVLCLVVAVSFTPALRVRGEDHLVSRSDLHGTIVKSAKTRQTNLEKVQRFFSSERVRQTLTSSKADLKKVENALPHLNDEELARLAAQTEKVQADLAGGALDNQQITYIVIALAAAVVVLILV
jgi:hypothetical protein